MRVHLVDGTYELFRQHFGQVSRHSDSHAMAAAAGVVASTLALIADGATHVGIASDHTIESFRNDLYDGYKDGAGMDEAILVADPRDGGSARCGGIRRLADGRPRSRRCTRRCGGGGRRRRAGRTGADRHPGQGPRTMCPGRTRRAIRPSEAGSPRRGGDHREVRDRTSLDSGLPRSRRRLGGWVPRAPGMGRQERFGGPRPLRPHRGHPRRRRVSGMSPVSAVPRSCRPLSRRNSPTPTCSAASPRSTPRSTVGAVDDWRWTGPTDRFDAVADRLGSPELADQARNLATAIS